MTTEKSLSQTLCNNAALNTWNRFCAPCLPSTVPCVSTDGPAAYPIPVQNIKPLLTVSFTSGDISLMNNYDDLSPTVIRSGLKGTKHTYLPPPQVGPTHICLLGCCLLHSLLC